MKKLSKAKPLVLLILGCTASGKSDIVCTLSHYVNIELISADSVQVYRGLDIGSAKPSKEEQSEFPHHLIDIKNFDETFSVGDFVSLTNPLINQIIKRGSVPVISGGTFFYIKNFLFGLSESPRSDKAIREKIEKQRNALGLNALYERLQILDPKYASTISSHDARRITRALEICEISGKKVSDFKLNTTIRNDINLKIFAIDTPREILKERIKKRVELMFELGLEDEIRNLRDKGAKKEYQSMKGIGYREFFENEYLSREEIKEAIYLDTIHYAKRQMTFIRSIPNVQFFSHDKIISEILKLEELSNYKNTQPIM